MKKCLYCQSLVDDQQYKCSHCGSGHFQNVCGNCQTVFDSGFCPNCGTRAGEKAKACPNCGTLTFSLYCPKCGTQMAHQAGWQASAQPFRQDRTEAVIIRPRGGVWMFLLILFLPFIGAWVVLLGRNYKQWLRVFAIFWTLMIAIPLLAGPSLFLALFMIAPVVVYFRRTRKRIFQVRD